MHMQFETFESRTLMSSAPVVDLNTAYVGDLTGDGKADIATLRSGQLQLLAGNGRGAWHEWATFPSDLRLTRVAAGDVNGDGDKDLIASGILAGAAGGSDQILVTTILSHGAWDDTATMHFGASLPHDDSSYDALAGDFNGDGKTDIGFAGRSNGIIAILIGLFREHQTFGQPQIIDSPFAANVRIATGDINGDGVADLVSLDGNGHTGVALSRGAGVFDDPFFFDLNVAGAPPTQRQLVGDVDGDGADDIIGFSAGSARVAKYMESDHVFYFTGTNSNHLPPDAQANSAVADLDGNGTGDLLAFRSNGSTVIAYTDDHGIFTPSLSTRSDRLTDQDIR